MRYEKKIVFFEENAFGDGKINYERGV